MDFNILTLSELRKALITRSINEVYRNHGKTCKERTKFEGYMRDQLIKQNVCSKNKIFTKVMDCDKSTSVLYLEDVCVIHVQCSVKDYLDSRDSNYVIKKCVERYHIPGVVVIFDPTGYTPERRWVCRNKDRKIYVETSNDLFRRAGVGKPNTSYIQESSNNVPLPVKAASEEIMGKQRRRDGNSISDEFKEDSRSNDDDDDDGKPRYESSFGENLNSKINNFFGLKLSSESYAYVHDSIIRQFTMDERERIRKAVWETRKFYTNSANLKDLGEYMVSELSDQFPTKEVSILRMTRVGVPIILIDKVCVIEVMNSSVREQDGEFDLSMVDQSLPGVFVRFTTRLEMPEIGWFSINEKGVIFKIEKVTKRPSGSEAQPTIAESGCVIS